MGGLCSGYWDVVGGLNGILAGLVSITAPCSTVDEWCAILIGLIGGVVYFLASELLLKLKIDDPLNAWPVHGACGVWGCLSVGIFATQRNIERAYGFGNTESPVRNGRQFAVQLAGILVIVLWTVLNCGALFFALKMAGILRISKGEEERGLDNVEHGVGYATSFMEAGGRLEEPVDKHEPVEEAAMEKQKAEK